MKIYNSMPHVTERKKLPWYQLEVINQWDWITKPVCFQDIGGHLISYCIYLNTYVSDDRNKTVLVTEITEDMKTSLSIMGYILSNKS